MITPYKGCWSLLVPLVAVALLHCFTFVDAVVEVEVGANATFVDLSNALSFAIQNATGSENIVITLLPGTHLVKRFVVNETKGGIAFVGVDFPTVTCDFSSPSPLYFARSSNVVIQGINFSGCSAVISITDFHNLTIHNCTFDDNSGIYGAISIATSSSVSIINVTIINNTAIQGGGILVSGATDLVVRNVVLRNNVAAISGGGAFFHQVKNGVLDNVLAESNIAGSSGGGIALSASYFDITRFSGILNRAKVGGAVYTSASTFSIRRADLIGNRASGSGGGLVMFYQSSCADAVDVELHRNSAELGGAIVVGNSYLFLVNTYISENNATKGGAVHTVNSSIQLRNSSLIDNEAVYGHEFYCQNSCIKLESTSQLCREVELFFATQPNYVPGVDCKACSITDETESPCLRTNSTARAACETDALQFCDWAPVIPSEVTSLQPQERAFHSMLLHGAGFVIFGGGAPNTTSEEPNLLNDVWRFDIESRKWTLLHNGRQPAPSPRRGHSAVLHEGGMIIFGGSVSGNGVSSEAWRFDLATHTWEELITDTLMGPGARAYHSSVIINTNATEEMIVFGGQSSDSTSIYSLNLRTYVWVLLPLTPNTQKPITRRGQAAFKSPLDGKFSIYSGVTAFPVCYGSDVWSFDRERYTWQRLSDDVSPWDWINQRWTWQSKPPGRAFSSMEVYGNFAILYGGGDIDNPKQRVWIFDARTHCWGLLVGLIEEAVVVPGSRQGHGSVVYKDGLYIFGGQDNSLVPRNDIYRLELSSLQSANTIECGERSWNAVVLVGVISGALWLNFLFMCLFGAISKAEKRPKAQKFETEMSLQPRWSPDTILTTKGDVDYAELFLGDKKMAKINARRAKLARARKLDKAARRAADADPNSDGEVNDEPSDEDDKESHSDTDEGNIKEAPAVVDLVPPGIIDPSIEVYITPRRTRRARRSSSQPTPLKIESSSDSESKTILEVNPNQPLDGHTNPFNALPDEVISEVFHFLQGRDLVRISEIDQRFNAISKDETIWRNLCYRYWTAADDVNVEDLKEDYPDFSYRDFFAVGATAFHRSILEQQFRVSHFRFHTTRPFFLLSFLAALQLFWVSLKLDGFSSGIAWPVVFIPTWLIDIFLIVILVNVLFVRIKHRRLSRPQLRGLSSTMRASIVFTTRPVPFLALTLMALMFILWTIFYSLRLEGIIVWTYWIATAPLFVVLFVATLIPVGLLCIQGFSFMWFAFGGPLFSLITLLLVISKVEGTTSNDWCLLFLPWWLSEVFVLCALIGVCMTVNKARFAKFASGAYIIYILCMITFRTLLCNNLGDSDTCSIGSAAYYPTIIISIPIHVILLFSVNTLILLIKEATS